MRIIGIDPGLNKIGWAILDKEKNGSINYIASGCITTSSKDEISVRLAHIHNSTHEIINLYSPKTASIEEVFVNSNAKSSLHLGFARGAIIACIGVNKLSLQEFAPNNIKKTLTGAGKADKTQIQKMINLLLPKATFKTEDESDVIAIAYTGLVSKF
jgi:crossover junction endodeoxyribonuclease RuvC